MGVIWGEPAATVYIRPQRYTKEFVDAHDTFTLSFFDGGWRKQLSYLGTVSGRDEDKVAKAGLTPAFDPAGPYFEEASLVFVCRKAYVQAFEAVSYTHLDVYKRQGLVLPSGVSAGGRVGRSGLFAARAGRASGERAVSRGMGEMCIRDRPRDSLRGKEPAEVLDSVGVRIDRGYADAQVVREGTQREAHTLSLIHI